MQPVQTQKTLSICFVIIIHVWPIASLPCAVEYQSSIIVSYPMSRGICKSLGRSYEHFNMSQGHTIILASRK